MSEDLINHLKFYRDLGFTEVDIPKRRSVPVVTSEPNAAVTEPSAAATPNVSESLSVIREDIGDCTRCRLHEGRNKLVFGDGNAEAKLVFVGEGPGADEDAQGIPFVGRTCERGGFISPTNLQYSGTTSVAFCGSVRPFCCEFVTGTLPPTHFA